MPIRRVRVRVVKGADKGAELELGDRSSARVGCDPEADLVLHDDSVSRFHLELTAEASSCVVRDLGSRNGTLVNGKALTESATLKDRDLVQVGPLTFAVSIEGAMVAAAKATSPAKPASPDDVSHDDIESWLVSDSKTTPPERPSGVYGGETLTIAAFKGNAAATPEAPAAAPLSRLGSHGGHEPKIPPQFFAASGSSMCVMLVTRRSPPSFHLASNT